jgi:hypothetical protein
VVERSMLGVGTFFFVLVLKRRASREPLHTGLDSACEWCMVLRVGHETAQSVAAKRVSDAAAVSGGRWQAVSFLLSWPLFFQRTGQFIFPAGRQSGRGTSGRRHEQTLERLPYWPGSVCLCASSRKQPVSEVEPACGLRQVGRCAASGANGVAPNSSVVVAANGAARRRHERGVWLLEESESEAHGERMAA